MNDIKIQIREAHIIVPEPDKDKKKIKPRDTFIKDLFLALEVWLTVLGLGLVLTLFFIFFIAGI